MKDFAGKVAVITGAGSGFGREFARRAHALGMKLVLADIEADALNAVVGELGSAGGQVIGEPVDVARGEDVQRLADRAFAEFGGVQLLFNNAGVGSGGLVWENSDRDWQWVLGVNLWGVIHGIRHFVPRMLAAGEPAHVVNTASVAGLVCAPNMGVYNVSKHAVVALTETLKHDLVLAGAPIGVTLLCPAYVPTGIARSHRNRPAELAPEAPTASQKQAQAAIAKAVDSGRLSAAEVAAMTFDAIAADRFYVLTHPQILPTVELRFDDILQQRNPSDPFSMKPQLKPQTPV
ncbi:MAG: SDR family oxidoreductase [Burkholderiaceae bacterium]|jgi:NAD(P)-dependent dehydrogenase (short-subunit alcohol dehydrogenase family)|nr:SDR family oxidoreductase [Burkholderiaceae bacterium]